MKKKVRRIQQDAHVPFHKIRFFSGDEVLLKMILMIILIIKRIYLMLYCDEDDKVFIQHQEKILDVSKSHLKNILNKLNLDKNQINKSKWSVNFFQMLKINEK
ncbi:hypothetical protein H311_03452 [Anncaliia algerae PRA109]|nr:hypothetical protein H311_03452 [Anncaliia algerae PRA109]